MKLTTHYTRVSLMTSLIVLACGGIFYFFAINHVARILLDEHLSEEVSELIGFTSLNNKLPLSDTTDKDQIMRFKVADRMTETQFFDTTYYHGKAGYRIEGRAVKGSVKVERSIYQFIIIIAKQSTNDIVRMVSYITLLLVFGLFVLVTLTNRFLLAGLWKPFYITLDQLKAFNLSGSDSIQPVNTSVKEFQELHSAVREMSQSAINEYQNLKAFTENSSHEMLTPLSVITSNLDIIIQDESLTENLLEQMQAIYHAANKLSRINQSLTLLVKIENDLIRDVEKIDLGSTLIDKERQFRELISAKKIRLSVKTVVKEIVVSKYLLDVLLNNLFSNAIRHNYDGGTIFIDLSYAYITFTNTGLKAPLNKETIFNRFQKGGRSEGMGLGLAISKGICVSNNWEIKYSYGNSLHTFSITFEN